VTRPPKLDGAQEAHLLALSCSPPPQGHARWTLRLLAERFVVLEGGAPISHEQVRRVLKKARTAKMAGGGGER
jgi:Homeodomain-like domain